MSQVQPAKAPLEDLMAAMDVVDTLRHQQLVVARELDSEGRRERLLQRLKTLYAAQGIAVPDSILLEGISALEQERFQYRPVKRSFATWLAGVWVSRSRWGKPLAFLLLLAALFFTIYFFSEVLPKHRLQAELPQQLQTSFAAIRGLAQEPPVVLRAQTRLDLGLQASVSNDLDQAQAALASLRQTHAQLLQEFDVRVISRPGEASGVWRVSDLNRDGRNYYLLVEAVDKSNHVVTQEILSEETNTRKQVKVWGVRVDEQTFYKVSQDKQDDGIIQANVVGRKRSGWLGVEYTIANRGGMITEW